LKKVIRKMNLKLLNNTLSPSLLYSNNGKNILINTPRGFYKNLDVEIDSVFITCYDSYHISDFKELNKFRKNKILKCYIPKGTKSFMETKFGDIDLILFEEIDNRSIVEGFEILYTKKGEWDYNSYALKKDNFIIAPSFSSFGEAFIEECEGKDLYLTAKYLEKTDRKDYCSVMYLKDICKKVNLGSINFIGLSKELKEILSDMLININKNILKNIKKIDTKYFLYKCMGINNMSKKYLNLSAKFHCVTPITQKAAKNSDDFFIVGFASVPVIDRQGEIITEAALKKAAGDLLKTENSTLFLNHNYDRPIGKILESKYQNGGLMIKAKITKTEEKIREQIKEGLWTSFSIGGIVHKAEEYKDKTTGEDALAVTDIELVEVSLVGVPANQEANLLEVIAKSLKKNIKSKEDEENVEPIKAKVINSISELEKKALRETEKERTVHSYDKINLFLDCPSHEQKTLQSAFSYFKLSLISKSINKTIEELGYEVTKEINLDSYGNLTRTVYMDLLTSRDTNEELIVDGIKFIKRGTDKLVVRITPGWGAFYVDIYSRGDSKELAKEFSDKRKEWAEENNFFKGEKITPDGKFLDLTEQSFDDLKIVEDKKKSIKVGALDFFNKKEVYKKNNLPFKRGIIFAGEPGTGKTLTGKILMNNTDSTFIWVTSADLKDNWGDIDINKFKNLLKMAKELAPCILFAEDIDDYLERKGAIDSIKTQMDGLDSLDGVVTILCTNYPERIPKSLIDRPSRFDDVIEFELPTKDLRYEILLAHTKGIEVENRESTLKEIAQKSEGLTGAHLKEVAIYALLLATDAEREQVTKEDLLKALSKVNKTRELIESMEDKKKYVKSIRTKNIVGGEKMPTDKDNKLNENEEIQEENIEQKEDEKETEKLEIEKFDVEKSLKDLHEKVDKFLEDVSEIKAFIFDVKEIEAEKLDTKEEDNDLKTPDKTEGSKEETTEEKEEEKETEEVKEETPEKKEEKPEDDTKERKGLVEEEEELSDEEKLLKKIEGMSPLEIMNNEEIWGQLPDDVKRKLTNNYLKNLTK